MKDAYNVWKRGRQKGCTINYEELTPEQQEKARACKTPEEMLAFAREEGLELSDDDLKAVSGGSWGESCDDYGCGMIGH